MKAYMAYAGDPADGAALVFANTSRQARNLATPTILDWHHNDPDIGFCDVRVKWLREDFSAAKLNDKPHVNDNPRACTDCRLWTAETVAGTYGNKCKICAEGCSCEDGSCDYCLRDEYGV